MKTTVLTSCPEKFYPYLGYRKNNFYDQVVLFREEQTGVILHDENKNNIGVIFADFDESLFERLDRVSIHFEV